MENCRSSAEIKDEIINGAFGTKLKGMGFLSFHSDDNHPDIDSDVVYFQLQRAAQLLPKATIEKIIAEVSEVAEDCGYAVDLYKHVGKEGTFNNSVTLIQFKVKCSSV